MISVYDNPVMKTFCPITLSVLIPFYNDDPSVLLHQLAKQAERDPDVEIIIYDDGSSNTAPNENIRHIAAHVPARIKILTNSENNGRSYARNVMTSFAKGDWVLFLDADMLPISDTFIKNYLSEICADHMDVMFGGFEVPPTSTSKDTELHRILSQSSDCLSVHERRKAGPQYVCSSNLCVRKKILGAEPFDNEFSGWGWEDSEWAARIAKSYRLMHIDNPALHLGLETSQTLLDRFKNSGKNYSRFVEKHPDIAPSLKLYRTSKKIGKLPGQHLLRPVWKSVVLSHIMPMRTRVIALKLWRASWYAEVIS